MAVVQALKKMARVRPVQGPAFDRRLGAYRFRIDLLGSIPEKRSRRSRHNLPLGAGPTRPLAVLTRWRIEGKKSCRA